MVLIFWWIHVVNDFGMVDYEEMQQDDKEKINNEFSFDIGIFEKRNLDNEDII